MFLQASWLLLVSLSWLAHKPVVNPGHGASAKPLSSDTGALKECIFRQLGSLYFRVGIHFTLYILFFSHSEELKPEKWLGSRTGSQQRRPKTAKQERNLKDKVKPLETRKGKHVSVQSPKGKNQEDIQTQGTRSSNQHKVPARPPPAIQPLLLAALQSLTCKEALRQALGASSNVL